MDNDSNTKKSHKKLYLFLLLVIAAAAAYFFIIRDNSLTDDNSSEAATVSVIQTEPVLPPVSKSTVVISKETEYRPSTDPKLQDAYCKNFFEEEVYTYQYLGQTSVEDPQIECS